VTPNSIRTDAAAASGPLAGLLVIDLSRALAGPHAAMMLGDLGARVIKVEAQGTGDDARGWGPPFVGPADDHQATYFLSCNRNKESTSLDLKSEDGRRTARSSASSRVPTYSSRTSEPASCSGSGSRTVGCTS
jgi:crotonobetainyl-CoA:carnitine CoA-transferase CaiB-like acyl-CoA transferase